ncbi:hypothetical protein [Kluyvera sichuanensis]
MTALTAFAREILAQTDAAGVLSKLSLGNSATRNVGTTTGTVAAGDDSRIVNAVQPGNQALCNARVNFNGVGSGTIKSAFNVSSVTRLSTGKYTINFTNPMTNINYCPAFSIGDGASTGTASAAVSMDSGGVTGNPAKTVNGITIITRSTNGVLDCAEVNMTIFGGNDE